MAKRMFIIANSVECMAAMLIAMGNMKIIVNPEDPKFQENTSIIEDAVSLCDQTIDGMMQKSVAEAIKCLWANEKVQEVYDRRSEYHLPDCAK